MKKGKRVAESKSEQEQIIDLKNRIAFLEREISQKQILIEFQDKMIELAEDIYGVDIKLKDNK